MNGKKYLVAHRNVTLEHCCLPAEIYKSLISPYIFQDNIL